MLKVFIGSTCRDLKDERRQILEKLESSLYGVGMETFIPDGRSSQEIGIEALRCSEIAIFLISPEYGSLIDDCKIKDCKSMICPMKNKKEKISYTHCEYFMALAEGKPNQAYVIGKDWEVIEILSKWSTIDWREVFKNPLFAGLTEENIDKYFKIAPKSLAFRNQVRNTFSPVFKNSDEISNDLAKNIIQWYSQGKIKLKDFCDRRDELKELIAKMEDSVEVCGVGGVGKTTLIQVAMLIQKLKGKRPVSIGTRQSYVTGSGYTVFNEKCRETQYEVIGNKISLDDISSALFVPSDKQNSDNNLRIKELSRSLEKNNIVLFIDDFHLADSDVIQLVQSAKNIVVSSKRGFGSTRSEITLKGVAKEDRKELINLIAKRVNKNLGISAIETIEEIAEGHPVSTEILVRNYEKIDFQKLTEFKSGLDLSSPTYIQEFLKRVVNDALTSDAFSLLKDLALINYEVSTNIDKDSLEQSLAIPNFQKIFGELIETGMLEKKKNQESHYRFVFRHIQDALRDDTSKSSHKKLVLYYEQKIRTIKKYEDIAEHIFHSIKSNPDDEAIDYFLQTAEEIRPAHTGYRRLLDIGIELSKDIQSTKKAAVLQKIGVLFLRLGRYTDAQKTLQEAQNIFQLVEDKKSLAYLEGIASVKENLGIIQYKMGHFFESEKMLKDSLELWTDLLKTSEEKALIGICETNCEIGHLYSFMNEFEKSNKFYQESLEMSKKLVNNFSRKHLDKIAMSTNNLGGLQYVQKHFVESEKAYKEALRIMQALALKNPEVYQTEVASIQNNLGTLYFEYKRYDDAEIAFKNSFEIRQALFKKNAEAFLPTMATMQNNLGYIYKKKCQFGKAEKALKKALEIRQSLVEKNPEAYLPRLANSQCSLANLYSTIGRLEEAELTYKNGLDNFQVLDELNPGIYSDEISTLRCGLGGVFFKQGKIKEAEENLSIALEIQQTLVKKNSVLYLPDLGRIKANFGAVYSKSGRFDETEKSLMEAITIFEQYLDENPELFLQDLISAKELLYSVYKKSKRLSEATRIKNELYKMRQEAIFKKNHY